MKKHLVFLVTVFLTNTLYCQDTQLKWAKQFAGTPGDSYYHDNGRTIKTDDHGNVYSVGNFRGIVDFDPGTNVYHLTSISNADLYISKIDSAGKFIWAKQIKGEFGCDVFSKSFVLTDDGILIGGFFTTKIDFDPGIGTYFLTNTSTEAFVLKLTLNGDFVWVKNIISTANNSISAVLGMSINKNREILLTGIFIASCDFDPGPQSYSISTLGYESDIFLLKLDANGNFMWVKTIGAGNYDYDGAESVVIDNNNNIYLTGYFKGTVDFDPGNGTNNLTSNGGRDFFLVKLSDNGNLIWARSIGGPGYDYALKLHIGSMGDIYLTGWFTGTVDFDPNAGVFNLSTAVPFTAYILKLDTASNFIWARMIEYAYPNDLTTDRSGFLYLTGSYQGHCDFDPGSSTFYMDAGYFDMFILKLNSSGNFIWSKSIGGSETELGSSIYLDTAKNIYVTGYFEDTADFDPELPVYKLSVNDPPSNPFVLKLGQCPNPAVFDTIVVTCDSFTLNNVTYASSGTYQQVLYNFVGCDSTITIHLTVNEKPRPHLGEDRKLCGSAQISPGVFANYLWHDNSVQPNFTVTTNGQYWVTVTNSNNCKATDTLNILAVDTIPGNFLPKDKNLCFGSVLNINLSGYQSYFWSTGTTSNRIQLSKPGMYFVHVIDNNNCPGSDTILIKRDNRCLYGIPNSFTPNNDSKNDYFRPIIQQDIVNYRFVIYNRYGQKVFETQNYSVGWDGKFKGKDQPVGTYAYYLSFTNGLGYNTEEKGTCILLR